jgi:hypothetical protein
MRLLPIVIRALAFAATAIALVTPAHGSDERTRAAIEAASAWLALVDDGQSAESYAAAGEGFRSTVSPEAWRAAVDGRVAELGKLRTRQPIKVNYFPAPEGAESGDWVMIRFIAAFGGRDEVSETVTVVRYPEDWGVSGYYIR